MSFLNVSKVPCCCTTNKENLTDLELCHIIRREVSCRMLVQYIDYLNLCFCHLGISSIPMFGLIVICMLLLSFAMLHVLTKFFFIPNFVTIIQYAPMTTFGNCYLFFGLFFIMPYYLGDWPICDSKHGALCALQISKLIGDLMKFFVVGVMVICIQGHRVEGVTLWSSMSFLMIMMGYLAKMISIRYKMVADAVFEPPYEHLFLFRSLFFVYTFILIQILVFVVSHETYKKKAIRVSSEQETFSDIDSDDEILGDYQKMMTFSTRELWWNSVNGYKNLHDYFTPLKIIMILPYTLLAHVIPVLTDRRYLHGWSKYVVCSSLILFPFVCIPVCFNGAIWVLILSISWFCSALVLISTHSLRRPNFVWMFAVVGILISSVTMTLLSREVENLIWQYVRMRYQMEPDHIPLMYFGICEVFCLAIIVNDLQHRRMSDASFGVVVSLLTYTTCLIFPFLYYQGCYNIKTEIAITAKTETSVKFLFLILSTSVLHISMSGYEFRMSLFFYLSGMTAMYVIYQWMIHYNWVQPLATLIRHQ